MRRELLLRVATGIRALLLGGAAAAVHGPVAVVIALAAASSMLASTYRPLLIAIMPWLVRSPAELSAVNVLGYGYYPGGAGLSGDVQIDTAENWTTNPQTGIDIREVLTHETRRFEQAYGTQRPV